MEVFDEDSLDRNKNKMDFALDIYFKWRVFRNFDKVSADEAAIIFSICALGEMSEKLKTEMLAALTWKAENAN